MRTDQTLPPALKTDPSWRIGIVYSSFYKEEIGAMVAGAKQVLLKAGITPTNITEHSVSGSFEIPLIGTALVFEKKVDALIGIGIIVEGETHHAELLARESARGIMDVQVRYGVPFAFEVLYVKKLRDAQVRSSGTNNKGAEAARAVLHSLAQIRKLRS
ncbi:MAG: 6,7-dimethyl-8-ribityllumazine synthase [Candidatus Peribacteraceae bacterium]|nr:6,7-dimethyl-8-ribityllumazine synthase [Candidatus Peribacteraceae bacterium]